MRAAEEPNMGLESHATEAGHGGSGLGVRQRALVLGAAEDAGEVGDELLLAADDAGQVEGVLAVGLRVGDALDEVAVAFDEEERVLCVDVGDEQVVEK